RLTALVAELPDMDAMYTTTLRRLCADSPELREYLLSLLAALLAVQEPVSVPELARLMGVPSGAGGALRTAVGHIRPLLSQATGDPKLRLLPGTYGDRTIERLDIPGAYGAVPALHIVPSGGATAAVCVAHGSGCDKTFYAWRLVDVLVAQGFAVLLLDLDGHGDSPRPQAFPTIIESVAAPARWLQARYARVALLGTSLGGSVTARAIAAGAPCAAVVLWGTPPQLRLTQAAYQRTQIAEALRIARPPLLHLFRDSSPYQLVRAWQTSGIRAHIGTWDLFDALDLLGSLTTLRARADRPPLLLVYAGRDAVLPPGAADAVRHASAGWGEFRLVRRASHVSLAIEPETISVTARWLGEQLGRA
ncbi:MAG: alpha/beta fold hydrolase, partial [Chloroflexales bacterium]